jgi:peptide/nickel transport system substrate-binding protein
VVPTDTVWRRTLRDKITVAFGAICANKNRETQKPRIEVDTVKKFLRLGIPSAIALVMVITACGGGADPTSAPQATSTPQPVATATPVPPPTSTPEPTARKGGTLKYVPLGDQLGLDPAFSSYYQTQQHSIMINDFLFSMDDNLVPQPQMVDTWDLSGDGKVYNFSLRDGLRFHDGRAVEAGHIAAAMNRGIKVDTYGKHLVKSIDNIEGTDASTLRITLNKPIGLMIGALAYASSRFALSMPPEYTSLPISEQSAGEIGSGPWKFVQWRVGDRIDYERNADYVPRNEAASGYGGGKVAYLDAISWRIIPDSGTKVAAVETGQVDFVDWPPPDSFDRTKSNPDLVTVRDTAGPMAFIYINKLVPPFNDARARKALQAAVDQNAHLQAAYPASLASACGRIFGCSAATWGSDVGLQPWVVENDQALAQRLWDEVYKGETLVLVQWNGRPEYQNPGLVTKQILEDLGAKVEIFSTDTAAGSALVRNKEASNAGDWHVGHLVSTNYVDPISTSFLNPAYGYGGWTGGGPKVEELKAEFLATASDQRRQAIADEIQTSVLRDSEAIISGQTFRHKVWRNDLKDVIRAPVLTYQPFWGMWFDR